mmetsp:Transcript_9506/g.14330  ORF Transcript_9506/g.14330 Transcript_9506/m.14330 type:complete len:377 (+) Transcript_9506:271-1401(+)
MMMNTNFNDSIAHNISSVSSFNNINKMKAVNANKENENKDIKPSNLSSKLRPNKKKSVRFDDTKGGNITYTINTVRRASEMTSKEKQIAWYNSNEFEQFKYEAARHAGIKIVRYDNTTEEKTNQRNRFAMVGDFDDCSTVKDAASTSKKTSNVESTSSSSGKVATVKKFYNENEYNDTHTSKGESICKRGLGHHFSRNRKKSRAVTRSTVMAWQKMLLSGDNASSFSSSNPSSQKKMPTLSESNSITGRKLVIGKMQLMLSLVSAKCSRVAREEARWRGDVDYRVAYPERQRDDAAAANCNRDDTMTYKKRSCDNNNDNNGDDAGVISGGKNARCKRQRTSSGNTGSGGCREAGDDAKLSLTTSIGCINGILRTEL